MKYINPLVMISSQGAKEPIFLKFQSKFLTQPLPKSIGPFIDPPFWVEITELNSANFDPGSQGGDIDDVISLFIVSSASSMLETIFPLTVIFFIVNL